MKYMALTFVLVLCVCVSSGNSPLFEPRLSSATDALLHLVSPIRHGLRTHTHTSVASVSTPFNARQEALFMVASAMHSAVDPHSTPPETAYNPHTLQTTQRYQTQQNPQSPQISPHFTFATQTFASSSSASVYAAPAGSSYDKLYVDPTLMSRDWPAIQILARRLVTNRSRGEK